MINPLYKPDFLIKLFMICILLFAVHSIIFKYYINDLLKATYNNNLRQMIDTGFKNKIMNLKKNPIIKIILDLFPSNIKNAFNEENKEVVFYNKKFLSNLVSINLILIVVMFIFIYIYKITCNVNINLLNTIITIIIVLAFIGYFEYTFFINISNEYTPVLASELNKTFIDGIKNNLQ
jgi:hypothetical protein